MAAEQASLIKTLTTDEVKLLETEISQLQRFKNLLIETNLELAVRNKARQDFGNNFKRNFEDFNELKLLGEGVGIDITQLEYALLTDESRQQIFNLRDSIKADAAIINNRGAETAETVRQAYNRVQSNIEEIKDILENKTFDIRQAISGIGAGEEFTKFSLDIQRELLTLQTGYENLVNAFEAKLSEGPGTIPEAQWRELQLLWVNEIDLQREQIRNLLESSRKAALTPFERELEDLSEVGVNLDEEVIAGGLSQLPDAIRKGIAKLKADQRKLDIIGLSNEARDTIQRDIATKRAEVNNLIADFFKEPEETTALEDALKNFENLGISISGEDLADLVIGKDFAKFDERARALAERLRMLDTEQGEVRLEDLAAFNKDEAALRKEVNEALARQTESSLTSLLGGVSEAAKIGADPAQLERLIEANRQIEKLSEKIDELGSDATIAQVQELTEKEKAVREETEKLNKSFEEIASTFKTFTENFGKLFADSIRELDFSTFAQDFVNILLDGVNNALAEQVASFAQGFLDGLLGEESGIGEVLGGSIGEEGVEGAIGSGKGFADTLKGLFGFGGGGAEETGVAGLDFITPQGGPRGGKIDTGFGSDEGVKAVENLTTTIQKDTMVTAENATVGLGVGVGLAGLGAVIGGSTGQIISVIGTVLSAISGLIIALQVNTGASVFAEGGPVIGPGTGTSDSINARLSNGEFVVNAAATAANRPLLHAINKHRRNVRHLPGFADGGEFGSRGEMVRGSMPQGSNNESTVNNVTFSLEGDFDSRSERSIRRFISNGSLQAGLNQANIANGGKPVFNQG